MATTLDHNGMTVLPSHEFFESLLRPRRPTEDGFLGTYEPWVAVCFSATWCGPCRRLDKKSLVELTPGIKWYSCDIDANETTLGYCGLQSIPSFVLLHDGTFKGRKSGAGSVGDVLQWIAESGGPVAK